MNSKRDATKRVSSPSAAQLSRIGNRPQLSWSECPNCHERKPPHSACPQCGYYAGNTTPAAVNAEREIFDMQQKINRYLVAGDTEEVNRLQQRIAELQQRYGAVHGTRKGQDNEPTA